MKSLIIDNEDPIRESIVNLIKLFCPDIKEIRESNSVKNGLETLEHFTPDLLFLDVELGDGTGMDLLNQLQNPSFKVIFITAHDKYAVNAFRHSALDFLLKPINPEELVAAVQKTKEAISNQNIVSQLSVLKDYLKPGVQNEHKVVLKDNQSIYFVKVNDIIRCESETSYTTFYLTTGEEIVISKKIKEFDELLEPHGFLRVHQSHLVNTKKIKRFDKQEGGFIVLDNGHTVPVAQRKKDYVLSVLSK